MGRPAVTTSGRYGRLTVVSRGKSRDGDEHVRWLCVCECGGFVTVAGRYLRSGETKSCGCLITEHAKRLNKSRKLSTHDRVMRKTARRYRDGAKTRGLEYNLTTEEAIELCLKPCAYCGAAYSLACDGVNYNGIDRIDSSLGYSKGNCAPCCDKCNRAKSVWTLAEFKSWISKVYNHLQEGNRG